MGISMNLFDIIGPVMVGPSSSHTAGAVKIGYVTRKLLGEPIASAKILLHGSFAATGKGHGTHFAIIAGLLGMLPDDVRIPKSLDISKESNMNIEFGKIELEDRHPNSVQLVLEGVNSRKLTVIGESIGGSLINIANVDGLEANFSGEHPTLIVHNLDQPGHVAEVTSMLAHKSVNIASMQLYRAKRGGNAVMVIECDQEVPIESVKWLEHLEGVEKVTYYSLL